MEKDEECEVERVGEAYEILRSKMENEWTRVVTIVGKSKPWWKASWKDLRKAARKLKTARKELRREIRNAKRQMWDNWLDEGKDVWDMVQICKNPFNNRAPCRAIKDNDGNIYEEDHEKFEAFRRHNLITEPAEPRKEVGQQMRQRATDTAVRRVEQALRKTKNNSAPGPDGVSWKLLKKIQNTALGRAVIQDVAQVAGGQYATRMPES